MCQAATRRPCNRFESCQIRKVASLLTEALKRSAKAVEALGHAGCMEKLTGGVLVKAAAEGAKAGVA